MADLARRGERAGRTVPTLAIDTEIRLASAADRAALAEDLAEAVAALAARYHDESAERGRWYRLVVASHPRPATDRATNRATEPEPTRTEESTGEH